MRHNYFLSVLLLIALGLPLTWAVAAAASAALDGDAWRNLAASPQTLEALGLTLWTGLASTLLSVLCAARLLGSAHASAQWARLMRCLGPMLAVPHAGFAIGVLALIAPSGWLIRAFSPWATGWAAPPPWVTTQDPWGLGLIAVLVLKETPFLLWAAATQLQRAEVAQRFTAETHVARSMGYTAQAIWWRIVWPQLWPRLRWPMLAVLAYSLTVVDVALVIGPTSPPTLGVLAWRWLLDADVARNAQGAAAAWLLALLLGVSASALWFVPNLKVWRVRWTSGVRGPALAGSRALSLQSAGAVALITTYLAVLLALLVGSISGVWAFPALLPQTMTWGAWRSVWASAGTLGTTLALGLASSTFALLWSVAWLEFAPPTWDASLRRAIYLPLVLPPVLWMIGVHSITLRWGIDATWQGVWLAHTLATIPYALIALSPAYLGFDARYWHVTASLGHSRWTYLSRVKWPLLRGALAAAAAVGFAVSVAQYLPTLFIGAGRFATVTTEAVTLSSGAQRSLTSAYAALQWLLPVLGFGLAAWVARPRRFARPTPG